MGKNKMIFDGRVYELRNGKESVMFMNMWKRNFILVCTIFLSIIFLKVNVFAENTTQVNNNESIVTLDIGTQKAYALKMYLAKGTSKQIKLKLSGVDITRKASWKSSSKKIATVSSKGFVRAKRKGRVVISATYKGKTYKALVIVQNPSLSKKKLTLEVGESKKIKLKNNNQKITWFSKNPAVAKVDKNGKITAVSSGKTKIYAKIQENKKYACTVTVKKENNTNNAYEKYQTFLKQEKYLSDWNKYVQIDDQPGYYEILDINQDGEEELLIIGNGFLGEFYGFLIYRLDSISGEIEKTTVMSIDGYEIYSFYSDMRYSKNNKALIFSETRGSNYWYYKMSGKQIIPEKEYSYQIGDQSINGKVLP